MNNIFYLKFIYLIKFVYFTLNTNIYIFYLILIFVFLSFSVLFSFFSSFILFIISAFTSARFLLVLTVETSFLSSFSVALNSVFSEGSNSLLYSFFIFFEISLFFKGILFSIAIFSREAPPKNFPFHFLSFRFEILTPSPLLFLLFFFPPPESINWSPPIYIPT